MRRAGVTRCLSSRWAKIRPQEKQYILAVHTGFLLLWFRLGRNCLTNRRFLLSGAPQTFEDASNISLCYRLVKNLPLGTKKSPTTSRWGSSIGDQEGYERVPSTTSIGCPPFLRGFLGLSVVFGIAGVLAFLEPPRFLLTGTTFPTSASSACSSRVGFTRVVFLVGTVSTS